MKYILVFVSNIKIFWGKVQKLFLMDHQGSSIFCSGCQVKIHLYFLIGISPEIATKWEAAACRRVWIVFTGRFLYGSAFATTLYLPFSATCSNSKLSSASRARCLRPPRPRRGSRRPWARASCETWKWRWLISNQYRNPVKIPTILISSLSV